MSGAKIEKLVRMANQIAEAFAPLPEAEAIQSAATHLKKFWTPKMIGELSASARAGDDLLAPLARAAVLTLSEAPPDQN